MLRTTEPDSFFVFFAISFPVKLQRRRPTQKAKQRRDSLTLCLFGRRPIRRGRRGETLIWLVGAGFCGRTVDLPSVSCLRKCKVIETHWWLHAWHDATWTASLFVCHSSSVVSSDAENIIRRPPLVWSSWRETVDLWMFWMLQLEPKFWRFILQPNLWCFIPKPNFWCFITQRWRENLPKPTLPLSWSK